MKTTPLHLLANEIVIGCNKIAQFPLPFQLTHYVKQDHARFDPDTYESQILPHVGRAKLLLWDAFRDGDQTQEIEPMGDLPNTTWISRCKKHHYYAPGDFKAAQSWHLPQLCTAYNTISLMAQWAVILGADEIYLVGCDGEYTDGQTDHFDSNYYQEVDIRYEERNNLYLRTAHQIIKRSCPIPIYDATVGGKLEMYPKISLERIIKNGTHS